VQPPPPTPPQQQPPPQPQGGDKVAVCGYSIHLPGDITTGEQLFEMCRQKTQCRRDMVALGRYPASFVDESAEGSNPWKLKTRYCNMFSEEEGACRGLCVGLGPGGGRPTDWLVHRRMGLARPTRRPISIPHGPWTDWGGGSIDSTLPETLTFRSTRSQPPITSHAPPTVESYDCHFFRVTQKLAKSMDIRQVGVLQSVWHALEDAGIPAQRLYRTR
jgi:hypothetical protein